MRLITIAVATMLLAVVVPAYAHTDRPGDDTDDLHSTCGTHVGPSYGGTITVDETVYAQGGWWDDHKVIANTTQPGKTGSSSGAEATCGTTDDAEKRERGSPVWLHLKESSFNAPYEVTVTTHGAVIGGMDVFEYQHRNSGITPKCAQHVVLPQLYPGEGEGANEPASAYLFRVLHETVGYHQRGQTLTDFGIQAPEGDSLTQDITVTLEPDEEYIVAIYPQAATTYAATEDDVTASEERIDWSVAVDEGDLEVRDIDHDRRTQLPFDVASWIFPLDIVFDCSDDIPLPGVLLGGEAPELPTSDAPHHANELLATHLG